MFKFLTTIVVATMALSACTSKDNLTKLLKENPEILVEAIKANPAKIMTALSEANRAAQEDMAKNQEADAAKEIEDSIDNPLKPEIRADDSFRGPKDAPLTLVVYSDFQCPYCSRGFKNEEQLLEKYAGKIKVVFKNLPLPMHPQAMIAAQYYEAALLQDQDKAIKLHAKIFNNQQELSKGEDFLKSAAKSLGLDMKKLVSDVNSDKVKTHIKQDMEEAQKFGFQGTPGYLLNGVPVRGAYPVTHFDTIVEKLKEKGKITL